jgi:hypothetical protein
LCLAGDYPIVDTGQERCYNDAHETAYPTAGDPFFGQDAQYQGNQPAYRDNGDGTVSDLVTGLMWQKDPGPKRTFREAVAGAAACRVAGYDDWRLPTVKQLYSLILFSGIDPDPHSAASSKLRPFIDTDHFVFRYGDAAKGERVIDSQYATSTRYVGKTMGGNETMFGVNFADGRIKGYPIGRLGRVKKYYVMYVRGNAGYGKNRFHQNGDGTITDHATGLAWMKGDSGRLEAGENGDGKLNWQEALDWVESLEYAGRSDWRLPNVKELQSIVDYTRSPSTSESAAIDPVFDVTSITNEGGRKDYPFYWSGTTHARFNSGAQGAYVAFGESSGWMQSFRGEYQLLDVHGAGAQRSDPKAGDPSRFPRGRGPQGDVIRIDNLVRPVRGGEAVPKTDGPKVETTKAQAPGPGEGMRPGMRPGRDMGPPPGMPWGKPPPFVRRLDRNGDGRVSRSEFDGPASRFNDLDRDGDGYLSQQEAPRGPPPGKRPGVPGKRPLNRPARG